MKICLITAFPPSRGGLAEYGFHLARELRRNPFLSLTVLADQLPDGEAELDQFDVRRCWSANDPTSPARLLRVMHQLDPDVVWFNLLFSTFGYNPLAAFCGLTTPLLTRLRGYYTHVTLHHLMDTIDLGDAHVHFRSVYRGVGKVATRMLLASNSVSVLLPAYRQLLQEKYGAGNVYWRPHGILAHRPEPPDFSRRNNPDCRVLAFGKWGTYKRLEPMIAAFSQVRKKFPAAKLVIGGGDHPHTPGYVASIAKLHQGDPGIEFTGYVPEEKIPELFQSASVTVLPYTSSTGASGVVHLACTHGVPIMCADIEDFRRMAEDEALAIDFYRTGDMTDLAAHLLQLLQSSAQQRAMAEQNFSAALRMTMPQIIRRYLRQFELAERTRRLQPASRLRRWPGWLTHSVLGRRMTGGLRDWVYRPALTADPPSNGHGLKLLHGNGNGNGSVKRARLSLDHHVVGGPGNGGGGVRGEGAAVPAAGAQENEQPHNGSRQKDGQPLAPDSGNGNSGHPQAESEGAAQRSVLPGDFPRAETGGGNHRNGKRGAGSAASGSRNGGSESADQSGGQVRAGERDRVAE